MIDLSEAVMHWLEYQRCIGIDGFLNESALTIPIVGYLTSEGWETKKETDYSSVCPNISRDKCYADFYFERDEKKLILETKLFKSSAKNNVFDDLVRLALPVEPSLKRIAMVAFSNEKKLWGPYKELFDLPKGDRLDLNPHSVVLSKAGKPLPLEYNSKKFATLCDLTSVSLGGISVICDQRSSSKKYSVVVFSVGRV
jgi:hypothetical protein